MVNKEKVRTLTLLKPLPNTDYKIGFVFYESKDDGFHYFYNGADKEIPGSKRTYAKLYSKNFPKHFQEGMDYLKSGVLN